jgi:hypothetical protein
VSSYPGTSVNLWGQRFDPERGTPVGEPFKIALAQSPGLRIALGSYDEIGVAARRALLPMVTATGNIWLLENVDK